MSELVTNCPRCGAKNITFDVKQEHFVGERHNWQYWYEVFCICRNCNRSTTFVLSQKLDTNHEIVHEKGVLKLVGSVNRYMDVEGYITLKDSATIVPPEHVPERIADAFKEGAKCFAVGCYNAAATMFRLCVDIATREKLPEIDEAGLNAKIRRSLGLRLAWLFDSGRLPEALRDLSTCVKEDGNDGAHEGTLSKEDTEDLIDFTIALLERIFTEPQRLLLAKERRDSRRHGSKGD